MTPIEERLQKIAIEDFAQFLVIIGKQASINAKACMLKQEGFSYNQICIKLSISMQQARTACASLKNNELNSA